MDMEVIPFMFSGYVNYNITLFSITRLVHYLAAILVHFVSAADTRFLAAHKTRRRRITAVQLRDIGDAFGPCQLEEFLVEVVGRNSQCCAAYCKSVKRKI
jgi:hypothetical protein